MSAPLATGTQTLVYVIITLVIFQVISEIRVLKQKKVRVVSIACIWMIYYFFSYMRRVDILRQRGENRKRS